MSTDTEAPDDQLAALNEKHFVVRIGKDMVVGTETEDDVFFMPFPSFIKMYYNQYAGTKRLGQKWLDWSGCRRYEEVRFAPPGAQEVAKKHYNLWRGFDVEPVRNDPVPFIERYLCHAYEVVANANPLYAEYVLDLLADVVQSPGRPVGKALALRSPQGLGKSVFIEAFGRLFGRHFASLSSRAQLTGAFNGHLSGKIVVFADEAIWGGNKQDIGVLKHFVTQRVIPIQFKGVDIMFQPNYAHLFLATNEDWAWPAGNEERRAVILDLQRRMPPSYFDALWKEIEDPRFLPALLKYLKDRPIDYTRLRKGLDTEGLREQKELTASLGQQWFKQVLEDGGLSPRYEWQIVVPTQTLYQKFVDEMGSTRGVGQSHRSTKAHFVRGIQALVPAAFLDRRKAVIDSTPGRNPTYVTATTSCFIFPDLHICRQSYDRVTGSEHVWPPIETQPELIAEGE